MRFKLKQKPNGDAYVLDTRKSAIMYSAAAMLVLLSLIYRDIEIHDISRIAFCAIISLLLAKGALKISKTHL